MTNILDFPNGIRLLQGWQRGDAEYCAALRDVLSETVNGRYDSNFAWKGPIDAVHVGGAINLVTLTMMHKFFGQDSAQFYKGDMLAYVRSTLMTRRLLGMNKLYISWPVYAFTAEALGQKTMYPDKFPPGSDPDVMLINRDNWQSDWTPDFDTGTPALIKEMIGHYVNLTGLEPILHLSAPYSLAADAFGQEPLLAALVHEPDFVEQLLRHIVDTVHRPWIEDFLRHFPGAWIELSDASGSPFFVGPKNCRDVSIAAIRYLTEGMTWGHRVYDANYRGDYVTQVTPKNRRRARGGGGPDTTEQVGLDALTEAKHSVCQPYVMRLYDDRVPIEFYRDKAIDKNVPLCTGIGSSQIDRNSVTDIAAECAALRNLTSDHVEAVKTVARTIAANGYDNRAQPWPGTIYFEDVSSESSFELIEAIVGTALTQGGYTLPGPDHPAGKYGMPPVASVSSIT